MKTLICAACVVIILAGLKAASAVIVPFLLAVFVAIVVSPVIIFLQKAKIPKPISFVLVVAVFLGILSVLGAVVLSAMSEFSAELPQLQEKFRLLSHEFYLKLYSLGLLSKEADFANLLDVNSIFGATSGVLKHTGSLISKSFFIMLLVGFMLFETDIIKQKIEYFSRQNSGTNRIIDDFVSNLKRYLLIKSLASALTGFIIAILLYLIDMPYAPLWGIVAFTLNYIPTIGSIIAAIPALVISLLVADFAVTFWVAAIFLAVNLMIGNFIEPKFLGDRLGISTIVVLLSLLLWGYVLGVGGLFLALPLTMSLKIALLSNPKTKIISILLSNKTDE